MDKSVENKPNIRKVYRFLNIFSVITICIIFLSFFTLYKKSLECSKLKETVSNLSAELSLLNDKMASVNNEQQSNDCQPCQDIDFNSLLKVASQRFLLLKQLIKLQEAIKTGKNIEEFTIDTSEIKDSYLLKSVIEINNTSKNLLPYYQLKYNFNIAKEEVEKEITSSKLRGLGVSARMASWISKVFSYRLLNKPSLSSKDPEESLIKAEEYLEKGNLNLLIQELDRLSSFQKIKECQKSFDEYLQTMLHIKSVIDYICNLKEMK